jgi:hypothetical protein
MLAGICTRQDFLVLNCFAVCFSTRARHSHYAKREFCGKTATLPERYAKHGRVKHYFPEFNLFLTRRWVGLKFGLTQLRKIVFGCVRSPRCCIVVSSFQDDGVVE